MRAGFCQGQGGSVAVINRDELGSMCNGGFGDERINDGEDGGDDFAVNCELIARGSEEKRHR